MPARRSAKARSRGRERQPKKPVALYAGASIAVGGLASLLVLTVAKAPDRVGEDGCVLDAKPDAVVAVVVDASGEFTPLQKAAVVDRLWRAVAIVSGSSDGVRIVGGVRVDVYPAVAERGGVVKSVSSLCSPVELTGLDAMVGNPRRNEARYDRTFRQETERAVLSLVGSEEAASSPILESLAAVTELSFAGRDRREAQAVVLISDLIQHSAAMSFYRTPDRSFPEFAELPASNGVRADLRNGSLCPVLISRDGITESGLQTVGLGQWWEQYAAASGGALQMTCLSEFQL